MGQIKEMCKGEDFDLAIECMKCVGYTVDQIVQIVGYMFYDSYHIKVKKGRIYKTHKIDSWMWYTSHEWIEDVRTTKIILKSH